MRGEVMPPINWLALLGVLAMMAFAVVVLMPYEAADRWLDRKRALAAEGALFVILTDMETVIEIKNLEKNYKKFPAVRGISLEVMKGEIFGILGPNGAGKTTTLEIIEGLKKQTSGTCKVLGLDNLEDGIEIKKRIGVQLQSSEYLNDLNLSELLNLFASLYKTKVNAKKVLSRVGLEDKYKNTVKQLSGGQKQRFTIASVLVHTPEILFMDEPTTGLDPQARREMWQLIRELNKSGITIVLTTHYMEEAEYLCNRVAIMDTGKILRVDSPQKLISDVSKLYKLSFFCDEILDQNTFDGIGIEKFIAEHPKYILEIENLDTLNKVAARLKEKGIDHKFLNLKTANLEDVYLELTGHEYES